MSKTVLIYNWVRPDRANLAGGGVSVYIQGLIEIFKNRGSTIDFLAAGESYHMVKKKPFLRVDSPAPKGCRNCWEIVNSAVKAPAHHMFGDLGVAIRGDEPTNEVLKSFFSENTYDHIIINNVEGIPTNVFELIKKLQPDSKLIVVAHNYHLICPQIELLYRGEERCENYDDGNKCLSCLKYQQPLKNHEIKLSRFRHFKETLSPFHEVLTKQALFLGSLKNIKRFPKKSAPAPALTKSIQEQIQEDSEALQWWAGINFAFKNWRLQNIKALNTHVDSIICVSDTVKTQFEKVGVQSGKLHTIHLSMPCVEERFPARTKIPTGPITLSFFGYEIPSKGIDIFLKALELMPPEVAKDFNILVVSDVSNSTQRLLSTLHKKFNSVELLRRYDRRQLKELLSRIDCNVAISRWWETYHQVTYEMVNYGVPSFVASNMGISELYADDSFFKLKKPDHTILLQKLVQLNENREHFLEPHYKTINLPTPKNYEKQFSNLL